MKKIKVMHVLCTSSYSGAENVAITLISALKDDVDSVYVSPSGSICDVLSDNGITHFSINQVNVNEIKKAIKFINPDIIHAHDFTAGIVCSLVAHKIPVINHLHNNSPWLRKYGLKSFAYAFCCKNIEEILTVSESVMKEFVFGKYFRSKTTVVGNPIDLSKILSKANVDSKKIYDVAFLGRLTEQKSPTAFVDIIGNLKKKNDNIKAIMIGDGELKEEVNSKIEELRLNGNIDLAGFQKNPYIFLARSKVLCMPSKWEGFGLAAVEALAYKLPVVASPVGGLKNIVNNSCGMLCVDEAEYSKEIDKLLNDNDYYKKKSDGAYKRAQEYDNIKLYSQGILSIYNKSLLNKENW